ncbi:unnamed protein product [Cuscuta campestris]|uniref:At4g14310 8-bladed propeller domain-containing protein n=1 Tax=Cuscuta campestris TaxID=132261 RepID=A0A484KEL8_9ASTE|nr:unnamed protein product [Cuscuta campestris]
MPTSSFRRVKERGGAGSKLGAPATSMAGTKISKTLTPLSQKSGVGGCDAGGESLRRSSGKENPRPTSRVRAATASSMQNKKPTLRAMPRIDKSSASSIDSGESRAEPRARWSTSSVPRGRSSSPSEFRKNLSDLRKCPRVSRVSGEQSKATAGDKSGAEQNSDFLEKCDVKSEISGKLGSKASKFCDDKDKDAIFSSDLKKSNFAAYRMQANLDSDSKNRSWDEGKVKSCAEKSSNSVESGSKDLRMLTKSSSLKEKGVKEEGKSGLCANKYPSKLHEKLAFLEGKVKRIASDIKRTKEMLDTNNPDASKLILSDIQEKISGIEKAMCRVEEVGTLGGSRSQNDERKAQEFVNMDVKNEVERKRFGSGLNAEELEARLFPHHKLLRDRASMNASGSTSKGQQLKDEFLTNESIKKEKPVGPVDQNPIAIEFLASMNKEQPKATTQVENADFEMMDAQDVDDVVNPSIQDSSMEVINETNNIDDMLTSDEKLNEFEDQENTPSINIEDDTEDNSMYQLNEIGHKTSTGGWFVSEGESVLLAHDDGSCTFYDIVHCEVKAEYKPPLCVMPHIWQDCWIVRAPGADGCSAKYVVAASAGNSINSGFCSWDFHSRDVRASHFEDGSSTITATSTRTALAPISNNTMRRRNSLSTVVPTENPQWWYKPCGPLIIAAASCQKMVRVYDIRDGEHVMEWGLSKPLLGMDHSSPLQWRSRGKVVMTETDGISLWDVNSTSPQALLSVSSSGRKISALHVSNTDAELGGGVRQRVSSSEAEGNDGFFCTSDAINVLDFRHPSGIAQKIPKVGVNVQSAFSRGDSIYLGCTTLKSAIKRQFCSQIQQVSLHKPGVLNTYPLPESSAHSHHSALAQVWGNSNLVMGVSGLGLFVFDSSKKDDRFQPSGLDQTDDTNLPQMIGPDDLFSPSFDFLASRVLLISRDRPALWRYLF